MSATFGCTLLQGIFDVPPRNQCVSRTTTPNSMPSPVYVRAETSTGSMSHFDLFRRKRYVHHLLASCSRVFPRCLVGDVGCVCGVIPPLNERYVPCTSKSWWQMSAHILLFFLFLFFFSLSQLRVFLRCLVGEIGCVCVFGSLLHERRVPCTAAT